MMRVEDVLLLMEAYRTKPKEKKYDDETVHTLLAYLRDATGLDKLDGHFATNYKACQNLIERCRAKSLDPYDNITSLIQTALADKFYGPRTTSFRFIENNAGAIFKTRQQRSLDPRTQAPEERAARAAADLQRRFAERRSEPAGSER